LVKFIANASLSNSEWELRWNDASVQEDKKKLIASNKFVKHFHDGVLNVDIQNIYFFLNFKVLFSGPEYEYI
jgi:hypothetical protein